MKKVYVDTSVLLRHVFNQPNASRKFKLLENLYTSQLTIVEAHRGIDRYRILNNWNDREVAFRLQTLATELEAFEIVPLHSVILKRASGAFATTVKTLDAIHLATALLVQNQKNEPLLFMTHDTQQAIAASASGFTIAGINEK